MELIKSAPTVHGALPAWAIGSGYGYGDGYGYGYGSGSGSGSGYGYGSGDGSGSGYGYGYGSGDGSGSGYGYGYGYGSGYGDGYGDGSGDGSGDGYGEYWAAAAEGFAAKLSDADLARVRAALAEGGRLAYWKSTKDGFPANGGSGNARKAGDVETISGPLRLCGPGALHATLNLEKWSGEKVWLVLLYAPVAEAEDKLGSLKREILMECK